MLQKLLRRPVQIMGLVALLAISLLTLSSTPAFAAQRQGEPASSWLSRVTCLSTYTHQYRPLNWVITAFPPSWFPGCVFNLFDHVVIIAPPPPTTTTICAASALPPDFLIIAEGSSLQCGGANQTILPATQISTYPSLTVCASSPIPTNWVTIAESRAPAAASTCSNGAENSNDPLQKTIEPAPFGTTALTICADSAIPLGFTHIGDEQDSACSLDSGSSPVIAILFGNPTIPKA